MRRATLAALAALTLASAAQAAPRGHYVSLPSPLAPLSTSPPLGGGAAASAEGFRHRVSSTTAVVASLDPDGTPFAVHATQRLEVGVKGDYFFTIGAPVLDVEAAPGSASTPGLRASSILWAGFNPGRRTLSARAKLDPAVAAGSLPLRVEIGDGRVTLVNATGAAAGTYRADAEPGPLVRYLAELTHAVDAGRPPASGGAYVTSTPVAASVRVLVPLRVRGTVGRHAVDLLLGKRAVVRAGGPVRLTVTPVLPEQLLRAPTSGLSGRQLLDRVTRATLTLARLRQYRTFLGNPDPSGPNETTYAYRSAARPAPPVPAAAPADRRDWALTLGVAAGLLVAAAGAAVVWARS